MSSNGNLVNMQQLYEQDLQAYIAHMNEELAAAQSLVDAMDAAESDKQGLQSQMNKLQQEMRSWLVHQHKYNTAQGWATLIWDESHYRATQYKVWKADQAKINADDALIQEKEKALESIDPDLSSTILTLNQLIADSDHLLEDNLNTSDLCKAFDQFEKIFSQICQVIIDKIQIDLAEAGEKEFGAEDNSSAAVLALASISIRGEFNEQSTLQAVQSEVFTDTVDWQKEKSDAQADLQTSHWYDFLTGGGPDKVKDLATVRAADAMMSILRDVEELISPMIETVDPGMQEFQIELDALIKKFHQFLNGHGSLLELKDAMIEALSIMVGIVAETSKDASMFDKEMTQGTQASAQMHMNDSLAQQEVIEDAKKYAHLMGRLMNAVKYGGIAVIFLLNPGMAMALMVILDAILNATGEINKLQEAIAKKCGDTGAAVLTGLIEGVGTAGGAAMIEAVMERLLVQLAIQASEETVEETAAAGTKSVVAASTKAADGSGEDAAQEVASKGINQAVQTAREKIIAAFLNQTIPEMLATVLTKTGREEFNIAVEMAQKQAAKNAAAEIQVLAEAAAKEGSASVVGDSEIKAVADTAANKGVAEAFDVSEESVAKLQTDTTAKAVASKAAKRAAFMFLSSAGSTGWSTDLVALALKKNKKDESLQDWMMVINAILEIIGMIGASGQGSELLSSPGVLNKILLGSSVVSDGAGALASSGESQANLEQAGAVKSISKDQGGLDVMQFVLEQLQKDGNLARKQYANQMAQIGRTNLKLSMHFNDAEAAVAQALAVSAV